MSYLSRYEDAFWFIKTFMEDRAYDRRQPILDVGSGLGYLTYSLRMMDCEASGIDLSQSAAEAARNRYGPYFSQDDVLELARQRPDQYGMIVLTEVIEHVPNPIVDALSKLLLPGGGLLVTTPNKSFCDPQMIWNGDAPPVHLWSFSENSIRQIATKTGLQVELWDFRARYGKKASDQARMPLDGSTLLEPTIGLNGAIVKKSSLNGVKRILSDGMYKAAGRRRTREMRISLQSAFSGMGVVMEREMVILSRSATTGAVFTRPR